MLWIYRFLNGYLTVAFFGEYPERILNLCAKNGITLWGSHYIKQKILCKISVRDFKRLPQIIKKSGMRVHIYKKTGFPFIAARYKKRCGFRVGIILFFVFLKLMSGFVWVIDVKGNKNISANEIIAACNQLGIYEGVSKGKIDSKNQAQQLLLNMEGLSWASLNIEGCKLTVNVSEVKNTGDGDAPSNLKATKDAIIRHIDITSGNCVVGVGDTVKRGDLLVSGIIEASDGTRFVASKGSVLAETRRAFTLSAKFSQSINVKTGEKSVKSVFKIFGIEIPLYLGKETQPYKSNLKEKRFTLFGNSLPICKYTKSFEFLKTKTVSYTEIELKAQLKEKLKQKLLNKKIDNYTLLKEEYTISDDKVILKAEISAIEDITNSEKLIINVGK